MKILFIGLERAGKLFSTERLFKQKLDESSLEDVEVVATDVANLKSLEGRHSERNLKEILAHGADIIIVMEKWQKEMLTRFMEYSAWHKIHFFGDICHHRVKHPSCDVDIAYRSENEKIHDGCKNLIEKLKLFIQKTQIDNSLVAM